MPVRILIADDSKMIRRSLRSFLEANPNWQVCDEAIDGREAVQKTKQLIPDLIILDLAMPVMNGLHAARKISQLLPSVPIVLYSMYATPQVELEAKKVGFGPWCRKPKRLAYCCQPLRLCWQRRHHTSDFSRNTGGVRWCSRQSRSKTRTAVWVFL